jgi:hypothetical protein
MTSVKPEKQSKTARWWTEYHRAPKKEAAVGGKTVVDGAWSPRASTGDVAWGTERAAAADNRRKASATTRTDKRCGRGTHAYPEGGKPQARAHHAPVTFERLDRKGRWREQRTTTGAAGWRVSSEHGRNWADLAPKKIVNLSLFQIYPPGAPTAASPLQGLWMGVFTKQNRKNNDKQIKKQNHHSPKRTRGLKPPPEQVRGDKTPQPYWLGDSSLHWTNPGRNQNL